MHISEPPIFQNCEFKALACVYERMDPRTSSVPEVGQFTIPTFVGTLLNWGLLGALAVQVYLYFYAFPSDRLTFKLAVGFIIVAEILQTLGNTRDALVVFGKGWGAPENLDLIGWAWFSCPMVGSTIGVVSQTFFAWRISILGRTRFIPVVIMAITAVQFSSAIWTSVLMLRVKTFSQLQIHLLKPPAVWLAATAAADLVCAATTAFYVIRNRRGNFSPTTLAALSRVLKVTVETGTLCAVFASVNLYLFIKYDGNNYHLGVCNWFSKIYSNSILLIMNSRAHIGHIPPEGTCPGTEVVFTSYNAPSTPLQVCVETVTTRRDSKGIISPVRPVFTSKHEHRMGVYRYGEEIPQSDGRA
ncbi:hypothetical protein C8F04DRAFT_1248523 [Mycena alexandri]|uniref:DUF6534 domain-containing protein n=1 Tax=Mycena alexandri TaxID=1745969 RepID=A0AAD6TJ66_9AGAR|nr:hypothetical protein C8F04DRAFT_1248523 [Mycena alexandri]